MEDFGIPLREWIRKTENSNKFNNEYMEIAKQILEIV